MKTIITLLVFLGIFAGIQAHGQIRQVKILKIEVDSKPVTSDFQLFLHRGNQKITPRRNGRSFEVPADLGADPVSVQIKIKGFDLWFSPVYPSKFTTNWIIGVDKKPFDSDNLGADKAKDIKLIYYLQFVSDIGDGTELIVTKKKKKKSEN